MQGPDPAGSQRAMSAMLQMKKLDIDKLKVVYAERARTRANDGSDAGVEDVMNPELEIRPEPATSSVSRRLLAWLEADLAARYPQASARRFDPDLFAAPGGHFVVAYVQSEPVACGGFRSVARDLAEIKRIYVRPEHRGRGLARALLATLEAEARRRGFERVILETQLRQPEAIELYRTSGYGQVEPLAPDADDTATVRFGKALDDACESQTPAVCGQLGGHGP
jgi:GNAT superfamily N-acetyltransferase